MSEPDAGFSPALQRRLQDAEETLEAIRAGEVDAVVVDGRNGQQVYTLESPDEPFRLFVEQMQEGALTVSADGIIVYCNPFFADLVGRPLEQVRGRSIYPLLDQECQDRFRALLHQSAAGVAHSECSLLSANGETIPAQLALNRLPDEATRMFGIVVTDLAARERAQQLDAKRRTAEQANAARDQFLAAVSHELRTPLNAILGWAQVLRRRNDIPESFQTALEVIERNAWSQAQLIDDLLDVSRVLAGKLRLELKRLELHDVINAAVATVQPSADAKGVEIRAEIGPGDIQVQGDADRLQQVVWNLISNAVKFTPEGGEVCVRLSRQEAFAQVEVCDTGIGIPPEFVPHLFELYHQIEGATTRRSGGLGLGLAIVKQLTELHGGEVWAESGGEGRGATFLLRLPGAPPAGATGPGRESLGRGLVPELDGVRVLLVEDEDDAREVLGQLLKNAGAEIVAAVASAAEALAALEQSSVDLLVSDIGLPGVDGYELIRRVRATGRSEKDLPAMAVSAFAAEGDRREAMRAGYQAHVSKPVNQDELYAVAARLTGQAMRR